MKNSFLENLNQGVLGLKPYEPGFEKSSGRFLLRYIKKHGNDGYYLEEWKKDMASYLKKVNELNTNPD